MCPHTPRCPDPSGPDREAARTVVSHPEQGWSLLCNASLFSRTPENCFPAAPPLHRTGRPT
jgi:hypothetical protein